MKACKSVLQTFSTLEKRHPKSLHFAGLCAALLIFLSLCAASITNSPFWYDESFTAYLMRYDVSGIIHYTALDVHPPLYYLLLKGWSVIFGTTTLGLRSLSTVLGALTLVSVYFLAKRLSNARRGVLAALIFALMPLVVTHSVEARMYPLVMLIAVLSTHVMLLAKESFAGGRIRAPQMRPASHDDIRAQKNAAKASELAHDSTPAHVSDTARTVLLHLAFAGLIAAGVWTQYFTALVFAAHFAWYIYTVRERSVKQWFWNCRYLLLSGVASVALFLPWVPALLSQLKTVGQSFWIPKITPGSPVDILAEALFFDNAAWIHDWRLLLLWGVVALYIYAFVKHTKARANVTKLMLFTGIIPVALLYAVSTHESFFISRYLLVSTIFLSLAVPVCLKCNKVTALLTLGMLFALAFGQFPFLERGFPSHTQGYDVATDKIKLEQDALNAGEIDQAEIKPSDPQKVVVSEQGGVYLLAPFEDEKLKVCYFSDDLTPGFGASEMVRENEAARLDVNALNAGEILWNVDDAEKRGYINEHPEKFELLFEEQLPGYDAFLRKYRVR